MRVTDIWPTKWRVIQADAECGRLGAWLMAAGYEKFLAVARSERHRGSIAAQVPGLARQVALRTSLDVVRQNNADVLILDGWSALSLSRFRTVRHARFAAMQVELTPLCWIAFLFGCLQVLLRRLNRPRLVRAGRGGPWLVAFGVRRPRPDSGARRFIPHAAGVEGFLRGLRQARVRHAVLRWFEELPQIAPGEDLDVLVADADLERVRTMLDDGPGIQPIDLYSVTGLPGADFRSMPYFPPYLADELLDRSVDHRGLCAVPAPREHFLSLAYHALYHKGAASGIPEKSGVGLRRSGIDHDYVASLGALACRLGLNASITLEALDAYLDSQGWRPPHDMLIRLARRNRWVKNLLNGPAHSAGDDRIAVFLVREEALRRGGIDRARRLIEHYGFQVLQSCHFDSHRATTLARSVRGGNWGRGPWPISGGPPVGAIVTFDPQPTAPSRRDKKKFPFLANARLLCKEKIRDAFNEDMAEDQRCNVIHSSDNGREAMDYLRIAMPDDVEAIVRRIPPAPASRAA